MAGEWTYCPALILWTSQHESMGGIGGDGGTGGGEENMGIRGRKEGRGRGQGRKRREERDYLRVQKREPRSTYVLVKMGYGVYEGQLSSEEEANHTTLRTETLSSRVLCVQRCASGPGNGNGAAQPLSRRLRSRRASPVTRPRRMASSTGAEHSLVVLLHERGLYWHPWLVCRRCPKQRPAGAQPANPNPGPQRVGRAYRRHLPRR